MSGAGGGAVAPVGRMALIGTGLIGGSLALALRRAQWVGTVVGVDRDPEQRERALALGIVDAVGEVEEAVAAADLVVLAVPLGAMGAVLEAVAPALPPEAVVTDVGSAKASVVLAARRHLGEAFPRFVAGHPIAGTEKSGPGAAFPELFQGRRVLLTPEADTDAAALARIRGLWEATGAVVEAVDVLEHDRVLAATSHLPHMLAFGLVDSLARRNHPEAIFRYAAGGFRDFTRIASSDPVMWRDVCTHNRDALLEALAGYRADLDEITQAIARGDGDTLLAIFSRAKHARDRHCC